MNCTKIHKACVTLKLPCQHLPHFEVNYSISFFELRPLPIQSLVPALHFKFNMATLAGKVKEAANPSALAVLTVMLFWGQVQNYMMRANLRNGSVSFGPSLYCPGG